MLYFKAEILLGNLLYYNPEGVSIEDIANYCKRIKENLASLHGFIGKDCYFERYEDQIDSAVRCYPHYFVRIGKYRRYREYDLSLFKGHLGEEVDKILSETARDLK